MAGWVKLHRSITDHWVFEDAEFFRCWMLMIMDANHQTKKHMFNGSLMTIERGQFIFGLEAYNRKTGMTIARLRRLLSMLETEGMINRQKTNKFSLISIVKYEDYQSDDRQKTSKTQADDKPIATPKECKELQEGKNKDIKPPAIVFNPTESVPQGVNSESWLEWVDYRKKAKKRISEAAAKKQFKMLLEYPESVQAEIINTSITNDYQGLFPPKGASNGTRPNDKESQRKAIRDATSGEGRNNW